MTTQTLPAAVHALPLPPAPAAPTAGPIAGPIAGAEAERTLAARVAFPLLVAGLALTCLGYAVLGWLLLQPLLRLLF